MKSKIYCTFCTGIQNVEPIHRVFDRENQPIHACHNCKPNILLDLALGQFFDNEEHRHFRRNLLASQFLPRQYMSFLRYQRLLNVAIQKERYEDVQAYRNEMQLIEYKYIK